MNAEPRRGSPFAWGLVLILAALAWRAVRYALVFPMWGDEAMLAVNFHDRTFAGLLRPLEYGQVAPPGFLWLELGAAKLLGFSEPVLRLVPFLAGVSAVLLFWRLARRLLDRRSALLSLAVLAASFYPTRYAAEVKPYSLDFLLATVILLAAWAVHAKPEARGRWIGLAVIGAAAAWLSYPSIFVSAGACGWLLLGGFRAPSRRAWPAVAAGLVILASFAAMYLVAGAGQRAGAPASYWEAGFPPVARPWALPLWALDVHTGMMLAYPNGGHSGGSAVSFLLAAAGGAVLWRTRRATLGLLLSPLPFMFVAAALEKYPYGASARVAQHVAPAACLLIGTGLVCALRRALGPRRAVRAIPFAAIPFLVVALAGIGRDVVRPYHSPADLQVREIVRGLADESAPEDRWVVYASRDTSGRAPAVATFVGMGGRIHFQLLSLAPGEVLWAPDPASLSPAGERGTALIACGNRIFEPDSAAWAAYAGSVGEALGEAVSAQRHELPDGEWIEVVRWR